MFECKTFLKDQRSCTRKQAYRHFTLGFKWWGKKYSLAENKTVSEEDCAKKKGMNPLLLLLL